MHNQFDVAIAAVATALSSSAGRVSGRTHVLLQAGDTLDGAELRRQLTLAGYTHVTQVVAPRRCNSWRTDRSVSDGQRASLSHRSIRRRDRKHPVDVDTQRSIYKVSSAAAAGARVPHGRGGANLIPSQFPREVRRRSFALARSQRHFQGVSTAGIDALPLFFESTAHHELSARRRDGLSLSRRGERDRIVLGRRGPGMGCCAATSQIPSFRRKLFLTANELYGALKPIRGSSSPERPAQGAPGVERAVSDTPQPQKHVEHSHRSPSCAGRRTASR